MLPTLVNSYAQARSEASPHDALTDAVYSMKLFNAYIAIQDDFDAVAAVGERALALPVRPSFAKRFPEFEGCWCVQCFQVYSQLAPFMYPQPGRRRTPHPATLVCLPLSPLVLSNRLHVCHAPPAAWATGRPVVVVLPSTHEALQWADLLSCLFVLVSLLSCKVSW